MTERVRHPRALAAFRAALYLTAGVVALGVAVLAATTVGLVAIVGAVALLAGQADLLAVVVLVGLVVATTGPLLWGLAVAARRVDREVTEADRVPDPVERVKRRYVEGDVDEAELERRLEGLLAADGDDSRAAATREPAARGRPAASRRARERARGDRGD